MTVLTSAFRPPFVVFLGDIQSAPYAKTAFGLAEWRAADCLGQVRMAGCAVDVGIPDLDLAAAKAAGARSLVIGSAAVGGGVPAAWVPVLCAAAELGIDIVAGLHLRLASLAGLAEAAARGGSRLIDLRVPPANLPVGTGRKRAGRRVLTVGTDCACGKKYTALRLAQDLRTAGHSADFRATGQTGIMIAGSGLPMDAVVADFLTGAAEALSPDAADNHWDVVEGQGGIFHPGYLQVTIGLLVGSQPDAFVLCHDPRRTHLMGWPAYPLPTPQAVIDRTIAVGSLTNPAIRCVGISLNTSGMSDTERQEHLVRYAGETGLPCIDPLIDGTAPIIQRMLEEFPG